MNQIVKAQYVMSMEQDIEYQQKVNKYSVSTNFITTLRYLVHH